MVELPQLSEARSTFDPPTIKYSTLAILGASLGLIASLPILLISDPIYTHYINSNSCPGMTGWFCLGVYSLGIWILQLVISLIGALGIGLFLRHRQAKHPWMVAFLGAVSALVINFPFILPSWSFQFALSSTSLQIAISTISHLILYPLLLIVYYRLSIYPWRSANSPSPDTTVTYVWLNFSQAILLAGLIGCALFSITSGFRLLSFLSFPAGLIVAHLIFKRQHAPRPGWTTLLATLFILLSSGFFHGAGLLLITIGANLNSSPWMALPEFMLSFILAQLVTYILGRQQRQATYVISTQGPLIIFKDKVILGLVVIILISAAYIWLQPYIFRLFYPS